jgi:thiol-disulfide isomerase/thioredoxin
MRARLAAPLTFTLFVVPAALSSQARAGELLCKANYDYSIEVNGTYPQGACFYQGDARGKWFIDIPSNKDGLLMDLTERKIFAVPRGRIAPAGDGELKVRDDLPPGSTAYAFSIDGPIIQFQADDAKIRVLPVLQRPPITGSTTIGELEADRPEYREGMKSYNPDPKSMAIIGKYPKQVEIEAYFATWCPHCKIYMPKLLRVLKDAKNPRIKVDLVGVPRNFTQANGPWSDKNLTSVPTIVVKVEGREITRMGAREGAVPEEELAGILQAVK